jgi:hypothetical protein
MAKAIEMIFPGGTLAQYDEVVGKMGLTASGPPPEGALFHWVAEDPRGLRVVDVWADEDAFNQFAAEQIGPITQQAGLAEPEVKVIDVHNYFGHEAMQTD